MNTAQFRNAKPQRKYRERSQLIKRQHLGLLEKHQDYKKRAVNYQKKRDQLKNLQLKSALKNKDEFNFRMIKGQVKDGQHIDIEDDMGDSDREELTKQIKTLNQNSLKAAIRSKEKLGHKLKQDLSLVQFNQNTRTIFVEDPNDEVFTQAVPQQQDQVNTATPQISQKLAKLTETLYEQERLKKFYTAVTKSKLKVHGKAHQKKKIKKNGLKGVRERLK